MAGRPGHLLNKRSLTSLAFEFSHELVFQSGGWRLNVLEPGRLVAKFRDGGTQNFDVQAGDLLLASFEEIYLRPKPA